MADQTEEDIHTLSIQIANQIINIANARLEIIEDCGHLSTMERPDEVNQAMREWLA